MSVVYEEVCEKVRTTRMYRDEARKYLKRINLIEKGVHMS